VFDVRLDSRVSNMLDADMRTTLAQRLVSIVWFVFDQTRFNRLAAHFNTLACLVTKQCFMVFGHQTFIVCPGPYALFFLAPVYVVISLQYGKEVVRFTERFCWLSCTVMAGVVTCVSKFLIICHWTYSFHMAVGSNLFVLSAFGKV